MTAGLYPNGQTFEALLAAPLEQFDPRSELLTSVLASISEYATAGSDTPSWLPPAGVHAPDPFDTYDAAEAAAFDELPYPRPRGDRCGDCGYRTGAAGHLTECGGAR